jgi:hypothetical protein
MDHYSKRQIVTAVLAVLIIVPLAIWGTLALLDLVIHHDPNDPLTKAGGLKPSQMQVK